MAEVVKPRPASTVLLLRDATARNEIEVFMMVRHYEIDFNSGALVFPGGSVDKGDGEIIANPALYSGGEGMEAGELSFRIAAIREKSVALTSYAIELVDALIPSATVSTPANATKMVL